MSREKMVLEFTYPNGKKTIDELVVRYQPIKLIMSSYDVLHSFSCQT